MTILYKTDNYSIKIRKIKVERRTPTSITYRKCGREITDLLDSDSYQHHESFALAKAHLVRRAEAELQEAMRQLKIAEERLQEVQNLTES